MKTPMQELIDQAIQRSRELSEEGRLLESLAVDYIIDLAKAQSMLEKEAMTHDKILSMTDEFVQSNRGEGQIFADYHYDMMADFALHILETFNTKER
jgi:hypothetical protein